MPGFVLVVVSYLLFAVFAAAFVLRTVRMARLPVHLRWELAPVPHEQGRDAYGGSYLEEFEWWTKPRKKSLVSELVYMSQEIVFLKSVWKHHRRLWWFSFPLHMGLYLLILMTAILFVAGLLASAGVRPGWGALHSGIPALAGAGYVLGFVGALGLLISRLTDARLKTVTTPVSLFNLVLLLAVFATGGCALALSREFLENMVGFVGALLTADPSVGTPFILALHLVLTLLFLAYLPFSRMMHFVAKYFTYHQVRWDDKPLVLGGPVEKEILGLLSQTVTWSGPHLGADGKKTWADIATEELKK